MVQSAYTCLSVSKIIRINPFTPNGISHCYELDEAISNFSVVGWNFKFHSNFKNKLL